ncbi:uncharacterized protein VDAG_03681 [Verticillium dahliae VdLs.17]|uniref:Uncharacterized protein n=1 Tax=Verticillium dahliae (strain VdLs.17 / ATCC MYA-4575 / FGSC 10137) TaxID=498257 RepID=G2X0A2_VERDV|nr:uncharacterized protein VDAG_03681 [Verticillium dahliae VdLs.17]EGY22243.1 hypothetical protein VDAG_03681 [Verticillium dahliae VdLs.17]
MPEFLVSGMLQSTEHDIAEFAKELGQADNNKDRISRTRARYERGNLSNLAGSCQAGMTANLS